MVLLGVLWYKHRQGVLKRLDSSPSSSMTRLDAFLVQMVCMFRSDVWWYAVLVLIRRLVVAIVLVLVDDSSVWVWLTLCNYCFLAGHCRLWPYKRQLDNQVEFLCLTLSACRRRC